MRRAGAWIALLASAILASCGPRAPLNPPRLVMDTETDFAIQLFVQATILLSQKYGFETVPYEEIRERSARAGFGTLPFMPPTTVRATPELVVRSRLTDQTVIASAFREKDLVKYYIRTGLRASQLICRNYLMELDEKNQYLDFLRKEFGIAYGVATGILALTHANRTLNQVALLSSGAINQGITAYEEYRFLSVDREAARVLVEAVQNKLAEYYFNLADSTDPNSAAGGFTFSDALHAVSKIEYQCTREGIRALLSRSISNSPSNIAIDGPTGTFVFHSTRDNTDPVPDNDTGVRTRSTFIADDSGNVLIRFVFPNGVLAAPDQGHAKEVNRFMAEKKITVSLASFLRSAAFAAQRAELAQRLRKRGLIP